MGTVLSFALDRSHWTASERIRLEALAEQILGDKRLQVSFGSTDDGAPWCAVTNEDGEVLVHVARVDGQFMVHFVAEDVVSYGADLREAFGQWLDGEPERRGVVVPFTRAAQAPDLLVMLAVATLLERHLRLGEALIVDDHGGGAPPPDAETDEDHPALVANDAQPETGPPAEASDRSGADDDARTIHTTIPTQGDPEGDGETPARAAVQIVFSSLSGSPGDAGPTGVAQAGPMILAARPQAGEGDEILIGGARAEHIRGGPGDDVLIGGGGRDTLEGGDGDDWIVLTAEAIADGGAGADTFVISTPEVMGHAETLLGTVLDFSAKEGDRLMTGRGEVVLVPRPEELDIASALAGTQDDRRVEVDIDGDGHIDGYVLLTGTVPAAGNDVLTPAGASVGWSDGLG